MANEKRGRPKKPDSEKKIVKIISLSKQSVEIVGVFQAKYGFNFSQAINYLIIKGQNDEK